MTQIYFGEKSVFIRVNPLFRNDMKKVGFVSLGCPKNLVDSEVMMGQLAEAGY